jgi:integrase
MDNHRQAEDILDHARELLRVVGTDPDRRSEVADLMVSAMRTKRSLPDLTDVRTRIGADLPLAETPALATYLIDWLASLTVDANTLNGYESHVRVHLIPHLGHLQLDKVRPRHIRAMLAAIVARNADLLVKAADPDPVVRASVAGRRATGANTRQRIRATLRKALNDALADELFVGVNSATLVKTPGVKPRPLMWEDERVAVWRATGQVPGPVMVWTGDLLDEFLTYAEQEDPDLFPMFRFLAYRGPRRGEVCGLRDAEVRIARREVTIDNQISTIGYSTRQKRPKSNAGNRIVAFDADTAAVLTTYLTRRAAHRLAAGPIWSESGLFFVRPDGRAWHPQVVTTRFRHLVRKAALPPVRLHDLRHCAATMALDAGVDIKVVQEQLGHTTSTLTRDTYQSVSMRQHQDAAEAVALKAAQRRREARRTINDTGPP